MVNEDERFSLVAGMIGTALVARLCGEIDSSNANATHRALLEVVPDLPKPELVVIDLTAVDYLSAAAIHELQAVAITCTERGIPTGLVVDSDSTVARVVAVMHLDDTLPTFDTLDQVREHCDARPVDYGLQ